MDGTDISDFYNCKICNYDFSITVQITPLDYWNRHAKISVTIHNSLH